MTVKEVAALHQRYGVGVHFHDVVPTFVGQAHQAVGDSQFVLADDHRAAVAEQFVVVEETSGNRVLDSHHAQHVGVGGHLGEHILKCVAADDLKLIACEILVGGDVVETAYNSLDCDSFYHNFF